MKISLSPTSSEEFLAALGARAIRVLFRALRAEQRFIKDELALAPDTTERGLVDPRIELRADLDALEAMIAGLPWNVGSSS